MPFAIGCDVGSQSLKAVVLTEDGQILATAGSPYQMIHKHSGWAEQDPAEYIHALSVAVHEAVVAAGIDPSEVRVLGLASQVDGVVPIDREQNPLRDAIIWLDRRAVDEAELLRQHVGNAAAFSRTGLNIDATHTGPKIMWLRQNEPQTFAKAASMPSVGGFLLAWMSGEVAQDHANASSTLFYDISSRGYSSQMLEAAGIDPALMPQIRNSTEVVGTLRPRAAEALGLSTNCQVVVGTGDEHGACVGAGGVTRDVVVDIAGTAEPVCVGSDRPLIDETGLVETHAHAVPDFYLIENPGFVSGGNTLWLAETIGCTQGKIFELAAGSEPGANGVRFIPALSGAMAPRWNDLMRGAFYGLGMNHGAADLARAVIEGNAFAFTDIVRRLREMGLGGRIRVVGGGRRSEFSLTTKATLAGCAIERVTTEETTAVGGAMLAAVGAGLFGSIDECVKAVVQVAPDVTVPDPAWHDRLEEAYGQYRTLYDTLEASFARGVA
jgi:Sugar (pentulose and hexulose) kinases